MGPGGKVSVLCHLLSNDFCVFFILSATHEQHPVGFEPSPADTQPLHWLYDNSLKIGRILSLNICRFYFLASSSPVPILGYMVRRTTKMIRVTMKTLARLVKTKTTTWGKKGRRPAKQRLTLRRAKDRRREKVPKIPRPRESDLSGPRRKVLGSGNRPRNGPEASGVRVDTRTRTTTRWPSSTSICRTENRLKFRSKF